MVILEKKEQKLLSIILVLSIIGLLTSVYLVYNHYAPPDDGSFCDFGASISCSLVNTSVFSKIVGIPVALLGALWFLITSLLALRARTEFKRTSLVGLFGWSLLGLLSIVYLVVAEIILKALCPLCTLVHILVLAILVISFYLFKKEHLSLSSITSLWGLGVSLAFLLFVMFFFFQSSPAEDGQYDLLAQCLSQKGVVMYGSFRCGVCAKTREMFGSSFQYIKEIECHPQGNNAQTQLCLDKGIEGTPTWALEINGLEIKRHTGFLSIDELRTFAGCP